MYLKIFFKFQMLTETLADAEVDIKSLKNIVERKDDELSQSEEQCRHLVRHSDPKMNNPIRKISHFRTANGILLRPFMYMGLTISSVLVIQPFIKYS